MIGLVAVFAFAVMFCGLAILVDRAQQAGTQHRAEAHGVSYDRQSNDTDLTTSGELMIVVFFWLGIVVSAVGYLLPTIIAFCRGHPQTAVIVIVNVFLGWTVLAWVLCLAYSLWNERRLDINANINLTQGGRRQF